MNKENKEKIEKLKQETKNLNQKIEIFMKIGYKE